MITEVEGIRVGHWTNPDAATGCTVILPPESTVGSCEWSKGGGPGDREWVLLQPEQRVDRVHAIVLSGGSAFGLASADGVMAWLEEKGVGWEVPEVARVPIVPAAILFDLGIGDPSVRPGAAEGRAACEAAMDGPVATGSVGAGMGCTAGKLHGREFAIKSGIGTAVWRRGDLVVASLVAANPVGDVLDEKGEVLAGSRAPEGTPPVSFDLRENTVLSVVATNAILTKQEAYLVARAGHDGVSTVVRPAHTRYDGDVVFSLGTCRVQASVDEVLGVAPLVLAEAIRQGVRAARGAAGIPGLADVG